MKAYYLIFLFFIGGMIVYTVKNKSDTKLGAIQAQESAFPVIDEISPGKYQITMEIEDASDAPVSDILWIQEAAQVAIDHNIPWFNVMDLTQSRYAVEGVIELQNDPMKADYDANEILSLHLTDQTE